MPVQIRSNAVHSICSPSRSLSPSLQLSSLVLEALLTRLDLRHYKIRHGHRAF